MTTRVCRLQTVRPKAPQVNQVVSEVTTIGIGLSTSLQYAGQDERKTKNETLTAA